MDEQKLKVLLVEDASMVVMAEKCVLEQFTGFNIDIVMNGKSACSLLKNHRYDLIILDLNLPDTTGQALAKHIQTNERNQHAVIVALTGTDVTEERDALKENGFSAVFQKPLSLETCTKMSLLCQQQLVKN